MKPNYHHEGLSDDNKVSSTKSEIERHTYPSVMTSHDRTYVEGVKNYGAKATTNVLSSRIYVTYSDNILNSIDAGWQPDLYGDNNTRLFTYWIVDS
ncbi:LOW QUALITY PROTEIN: hypothetical protein HID58_067500 [Brassica napus]|uniref:Neprosin PEP catalytic domain-containing protein n=1 Tax=Brassica napus TaxID=3708 RepID=A0ABQ7ZIU7_BRANA|nr:LOW QUALITY PROTEIN: hypothetical protein HID58_067500 [Brassica napus]